MKTMFLSAIVMVLVLGTGAYGQGDPGREQAQRLQGEARERLEKLQGEQARLRAAQEEIGAQIKKLEAQAKGAPVEKPQPERLKEAPKKPARAEIDKRELLKNMNPEQREMERRKWAEKMRLDQAGRARPRDPRPEGPGRERPGPPLEMAEAREREQRRMMGTQEPMRRMLEEMQGQLRKQQEALARQMMEAMERQRAEMMKGFEERMRAAAEQREMERAGMAEGLLKQIQELRGQVERLAAEVKRLQGARP